MSLAHIGFVISELEIIKNWYKEFFNFEEIKSFEKKEFELNGILLSNGEITLELLKPDKIIKSPKPLNNIVEASESQGLNHIAIYVNNINEIFLKMKNADCLLTDLIDNRFFSCGILMAQ